MDGLLVDGVALAARELSPELALVDPDLRAAALAEAPAIPRWSIDSSSAIVPLGVGLRWPPPARRRARRFLPAVGATIAAACLMLGVLEFPSLVHHLGPRTGETGTASRNLTWASVSRASGYRVLVVMGDRVVLDAVTTRPRVRLELAGGVYRWWVWPVTASGSRAPAIVRASLVIPST